MPFRTRFVLLLALFSLASILGCDETTGPAPGEGGTFAATVSGDASRAFAGGAVFTADAAGPEFGFAIALVDSVAAGAESVVRHAVYIFRDAGGAPTPGIHAVGAHNPFGVGMVLDGNGNDPLLCVAESGTVKITNATPSETRGSFDVRAFCFHVGEGLARDTVLASGSFRALSGSINVPDEVTEVPQFAGRFELQEAGGNPVPAPVFDGIVLIGEDEFVHLKITVTDGYFELDGTGGYEHRVSQEVRVDGHPAPALDWVDRGKCGLAGAELHCLSTLVANRGLTAALGDAALEVSQDLNGEGVVVQYGYVRRD